MPRPCPTPALRARLIAEGLEPGAWSNGPGDRYGSHDHGYDKVIVVAAGSIRFGLDVWSGRARARAIVSSSWPGPRTTRSSGPVGVTCLEAHLPHGSLLATARHAAGTW